MSTKIALLNIILILLLIATFLALAYFIYKGTETAHQRKWFPPSSAQSQTLYNGREGGNFIAPFVIDYQAMDRLALFNFENQPDSVYKSFEIQYFDDELHGKGFLVIGYRNDNKVDVYIQTGLKITSNYDETAAGLADKLERPMSTTKFEITDQYTVIDFDFEDKIGRPIKVHLLEDYRSKKRNPFNLLAPLGSGTQNPPAFPLYLMYDFSLVRQANTELSIEVDGKKMIPDNLPIPFDWESVYLVRFSSNPVILNWNKTFSGALDVFHPQDQSAFSARGFIYTLVNHNGHLEISSLRPR